MFSLPITVHLHIQIVKVITLFFCSKVHTFEGQRCQLPTMSDLEGINKFGDLMVGVLLPILSEKVYQNISFITKPSRVSCTTAILPYPVAIGTLLIWRLWQRGDLAPLRSTCRFDLDIYQLAQTFFFAVEEINMNPDILPNITLGYHVYDTCNVPHYELQGALEILTESSSPVPNYECRSKSPFTAVLGSIVSSNSIILANVLGVLRYPQVSILSSVALLSDRWKFPSFFRTIASDKFQTLGLAKLVLHFGWTWVGLLATDNDYGENGIHPIRQEIIKAGGCVAFTESIRVSLADRNAPRIVKTIKESTATVIIAFATINDMVPIMNEMLNQKISGKLFVANVGWSRNSFFIMEKYFPVLSGAVGLGSKSQVVPGLSDFLIRVENPSNLQQKWMKSAWENIFNCNFLAATRDSSSSQAPLNVCTGNETLSSVKDSSRFIAKLKFSPRMHAAVQVLARALENMRTCRLSDQVFSSETCASVWNFKPWQLLPYIRNVRITLNSGVEIYFDENGDIPDGYDIVNWQRTSDGTFGYAKVGSYDSSKSPGPVFTMDMRLVRWLMGDAQVPRSVCSESCPPGFRKASLQGQPTCCFECVPCLQGEISNQTDSVDCIKCSWDQWPNSQRTRCVPKTFEFLAFEEPMGGILAAVSIFSSFIPVFILNMFMQHKHTPIVKANNYTLSCLLLVLLSLGFLCPLVFIGNPQDEKCLLRQASFGLVFALCVSCILAKTIMVVLAFMATRPGSSLRKWTTPRVSYIIIIKSSLIQFIFCTIWLSVAPPFAQNNIQTKPGIIIIECNENSSIAFWTMLGYLFLLATICFIVAFLARRLPDSFNEAQFITFSMLAFLSVWISFIPAYISAQGKYTVAMEIFAILASSWALVICMFLPKCFIILFRPDMNSREHLMGRSTIYVKTITL
ncbi:extracellular calcium-sensing receptor-like [Hyperolius riggenbachi]|uniref:extracellular calcium-sensing receptor-like n=1 Tax=Hyperolius riggenbachi TaxID=752182 RepID=UPI0035A2AC1E